MSWVTEGPQTNPPNGTVLADTGVLATDQPTGNLTLLLVGAGNVAATFRLERRNALNDTIVLSQLLGSPLSVRIDALEYFNGERYRMTSFGSVVGSVQASLFF